MKTNYMKQKLLVLAGADVHSKVVSAAKEMGVYTIVTDFLENSPVIIPAQIEPPVRTLRATIPENGSH